MRIFVTGTGRCGTVTFSKAAKHADNYDVGHESHAGRVGDWVYPDGHLEVSSQLVIAIPILRRLYPDAKWVWMLRDREPTVRSIAKVQIVTDAFSSVWFQNPRPNPIDSAGALYDTFNGLCEALLPDAFVFRLETAKEQWQHCWDWLGLTGDFQGSLAEWDVRHNATKQTLYEWLGELFPSGGFYVEAGAHDGVGDSTTKRLEDEGWTGICVEPSDAFNGLKASRKCAVDNRCLWRYDNCQVEFRQVSGEAIELSGIAECFCDHWDRETRPHTNVLKRAVSLPTLLAEHNAPAVIEFLSLDTEGSEYEILCGHDWGRYTFRAISVEHNGVVEKRDKVRALLAAQGYIVDHANEIEDWFVRR